MRRALVVGITSYALAGNDLPGAVRDAEEVSALLSSHQDGSRNWDCRTLLDNMEDGEPITRARLREACSELFDPVFQGEVLFFFSGHGVLTPSGGFLATHDAQENDWGVSMDEIVALANGSRGSHKLILLDCCHSGAIANPGVINARGGQDPLALIQEGTTVLAASRGEELAYEAGGRGLFTSALVDALGGGAADHMGWVTAPSIYAYAERRFGAWDQRPVYKTHAAGVVVVRECAPLIERLKLRRLTEVFPNADSTVDLDPEYEPEDEHGNVHEPVNVEKVEIAALLKDFRDAGLVKPSVEGEQLYWTARRGHAVELTLRGREYHWLVTNGRI